MLAENSGSSERLSRRNLSVTSFAIVSVPSVSSWLPMGVGGDVVSSLIRPTYPSPQETKIRLNQKRNKKTTESLARYLDKKNNEIERYGYLSWATLPLSSHAGSVNSTPWFRYSVLAFLSRNLFLARVMMSPIVSDDVASGSTLRTTAERCVCLALLTSVRRIEGIMLMFCCFVRC